MFGNAIYNSPWKQRVKTVAHFIHNGYYSRLKRGAFDRFNEWTRAQYHRVKVSQKKTQYSISLYIWNLEDGNHDAYMRDNKKKVQM